MNYKVHLINRYIQNQKQNLTKPQDLKKKKKKL